MTSLVGQIRWTGFQRMLKLYCHPNRWTELQMDKKTVTKNEKVEPELVIEDLDLDLDLANEDCHLVSWQSQQELKPNKLNSFRQTNQRKRKISFLKSHLQKSIRRQQLESALITINEMILIDEWVSVLRRLSVIVLEDCYMYADYPILIWLLAYYSKHTTNISDQSRQYIYHLVAGLCYKTNWRDQNPIFTTDDQIREENLATLTNQDQSLIYSLWLRISYGGNDGDLNMFKLYVRKWWSVCHQPTDYQIEVNRLHRDLWGINLNKKLISIQDYCLFNDQSSKWLIPEAIDFHPFPEIIQELFITQKQKWTTQEIKRAIWVCASNVNHRVPQTNTITSEQNCWLDIQSDFYLLGQEKWLRLTKSIDFLLMKNL